MEYMILAKDKFGVFNCKCKDFEEALKEAREYADMGTIILAINRC